MHHAEWMVISLNHIVAFSRVATTDKHPVCCVRETSQHKWQVDSAGAHYANKSRFSCILQSGNSSHVSSAVCSPVADKTHDSWLKCKSFTHCYLAPTLCLYKGLAFLLLCLLAPLTLNPEPFSLGFTHLQPPYPVVVRSLSLESPHQFGSRILH